MSPTGIALIGGGLFARMEHMPGIMRCNSVQLKAIYSRTLRSAEKTAALNTQGSININLYSDDSYPGRSLEDLLARQDISGVIIALPIATQPKFIEQAIRAGKHVLAEKPIGPDINSAKGMIKAVSLYPSATLSIAENYRFIPKFIYAAEQARQLGRVQHFSVKVFSFMEADNFWYETEWRRNPQHQGGPILDGGVHYAAATRLFLQGQSAAQSVSALTTLTRDYLPPIDTISATIQLKSGAAGTVQFSFGSHIEAFEWDIGLEGGWVKVSDETVTVKPVGEEAIVKDFDPTSGVAEEIAAWAKGMALQRPSQQQSVQEALADLEFLDKIFKSGEQQGAIVKYELQ